MIEVGKRYVERAGLRVVRVTAIMHNSFIGEDVVQFVYLDEPDLTRQLMIPEFERLTIAKPETP